MHTTGHTTGSGLNPKYLDMQGNIADPTGIGTAKQYLYSKKRGEEGMQIPLGGGGGSNIGAAWEDYDRQMALLDKIAEMSVIIFPSSTYITTTTTT
jgi:hypothetical protein